MKKKIFWFQGGSNPWPHDYWPDALTSWAMFFSKPNYFHQAVNYSLHWTNKNRYPRSIRPFFGVVKIALYNEQFLLRIIGLCWPIFQWSRFFFPQCRYLSTYRENFYLFKNFRSCVWLNIFCRLSLDFFKILETGV